MDRFELPILILKNHSYYFTENSEDQRLYIFPGKINYGNVVRTDTLYIVNNYRLKPYLTIQSTGLTDNVFLSWPYVVVEVLNNNGGQYVYHMTDRKGKLAYNGFTDDFYHTGQTKIRPIPHENMFYFVKEAEYTDKVKLEPNPTLYVGTFKK